ncbi:O-methyltransferase [Saccharibacillus sp. JS10]|uniref:O-methyltransferase n=1 Tax=Saccharibacillus sp. JS10 TaxID=2950552 RepID=UPI00210DF362|nr:O-methyltransferase [Saccharibacillus sp. JS10]MCQ4088278.1 O-methyltransferase [Saccharibacillus sp. JS10]
MNTNIQPQDLSNTWAKVDQYLEQKLIKQDSTLENALDANEVAGLPSYDVSPLQGKLLNLLIRMRGAKRVLEIGTLGGYSAIWIARALPQDGNLTTLELDPRYAEVARNNLRHANVPDGQVQIRVGDARVQLTQLVEEGAEAFDFIFIDADKPSNPAYLEAALRLSKPGTVILADNVVRNGEVIDETSEDARVKGIREFFEKLQKEQKIESTALQTVGIKGYDGFMIGIVN